MGSKALTDWLSFTGTEPNDIAAQVCRSLLNDEPFEPVFKIGDKSLRLCKIKLETKENNRPAAPSFRRYHARFPKTKPTEYFTVDYRTSVNLPYESPRFSLF